MKPDTYTKTMLTVIAGCLVLLVLNQLNLVPVVKASDNTVTNAGTVNVPVNEDGTIDVRLKENLNEKIMDVNVVRVSGNSVREGLPIIPKEHALSVNVEEVGGYQVYGAVPIKNE